MGPASTYRQNETPTWLDNAWTDEQGLQRPSPAYTLTYFFAGPSTAPVSLVGTPLAGGWSTTIDAVNSAKLLPGKYWWQAILVGTGYRRVIGEGELAIEADLATQTGNYDGSSLAEKALAQWEAAASALTTGGTTKSYTIGSRHLTYQDLPHISQMVDYWRARVNAEKSVASGGSDRFITQITPRG